MEEKNIGLTDMDAVCEKSEACVEDVAVAVENSGGETDYEMLMRALGDEEVRERLIFGNEELCNEIIGRYLDELTLLRGVPLVRGFSAISPIPRPKSLDEAKAIVDKGKIK